MGHFVLIRDDNSWSSETLHFICKVGERAIIFRKIKNSIKPHKTVREQGSIFKRLLCKKKSRKYSEHSEGKTAGSKFSGKNIEMALMQGWDINTLGKVVS